ncbi:MAG: N-6 DNA methylase [Ferruginibacter sp.]
MPSREPAQAEKSNANIRIAGSSFSRFCFMGFLVLRWVIGLCLIFRTFFIGDYCNGGLLPSSAADFAFLLYGLHFFGREGTMGLILSHGVLIRGGAGQRIRTKLFSACGKHGSTLLVKRVCITHVHDFFLMQLYDDTRKFGKKSKKLFRIKQWENP